MVHPFAFFRRSVARLESLPSEQFWLGVSVSSAIGAWLAAVALADVGDTRNRIVQGRLNMAATAPAAWLSDHPTFSAAGWTVFMREGTTECGIFAGDDRAWMVRAAAPTARSCLDGRQIALPPGTPSIDSIAAGIVDPQGRMVYSRKEVDQVALHAALELYDGR